MNTKQTESAQTFEPPFAQTTAQTLQIWVSQKLLHNCRFPIHLRLRPQKSKFTMFVRRNSIEFWITINLKLILAKRQPFSLLFPLACKSVKSIRPQCLELAGSLRKSIEFWIAVKSK